MKLTSYFLLSAVQSALKLATAFTLMKLLALSAGPEGFGVFNQFQGFLAMTALFATAPITTGLVKQASACRDNQLARQALYVSASWIALCVALLSGLILVVAARQISEFLFGVDQFAYLVRCAAFANLCMVASSLFQSILNVEGALKRLAAGQIAGNLLSLLLTAVLLRTHGIHAAMLGLLLGSLATLLCVILLTRRQWWFNSKLLERFRWDNAKRLAPYAFTTLVTAISVPLVDLMLRQRIADQYSWGEAGWLQGLTRISEAYLLVIVSVLSSYFLPRAAAARDEAELKYVITGILRLVLPVASLLALGIYIFREQLVLIVYSPAFLPILPAFKIQLLGDVLRIIATICGFLILAKRSPAIFLITELAFSLAYLLLGFWWIDKWGWVGATYAFTGAHLIYLALAMNYAYGALRFSHIEAKR